MSVVERASVRASAEETWRHAGTGGTSTSPLHNLTYQLNEEVGVLAGGGGLEGNADDEGDAGAQFEIGELVPAVVLAQLPSASKESKTQSWRKKARKQIQQQPAPNTWNAHSLVKRNSIKLSRWIAAVLSSESCSIEF